MMPLRWGHKILRSRAGLWLAYRAQLVWWNPYVAREWALFELVSYPD